MKISQKEIENKERIIVGVNEYADEQDDIDIPILKIDPEGEKIQFARLNKIRSSRDQTKWEKALDALRKNAEGDANLMPFILDAVKAQATLGETCDVLREVFGEYEEPAVF